MSRRRSWMHAQLARAADLAGWFLLILALLGGMDYAGARLGLWSKAPAVIVQDCKGVRI